MLAELALASATADGSGASFRFRDEVVAAVREWARALGEQSGTGPVRLRHHLDFDEDGWRRERWDNDKQDAHASAREGRYDWILTVNTAEYVVRVAARDADLRWRR